MSPALIIASLLGMLTYIIRATSYIDHYDLNLDLLYMYSALTV